MEGFVNVVPVCPARRGEDAPKRHIGFVPFRVSRTNPGAGRRDRP
jgi:hypothetical protein